jgi:uncharacterized membrane protein YeiH
VKDQLTPRERRTYLIICYGFLVLVFVASYLAPRVPRQYLLYVNVVDFLALAVFMIFGYAAKRDIRVLDLRRNGEHKDRHRAAQ